MTTEEAIKRIEDHMEAHKIGEYPHIRLDVALNMALDALRTQQTHAKLGRSRWEGCHYCDGDETAMELDWIYGLDHILTDYKFCPMCGRPLTEEAWAELERRISGGANNK